ncbi:hypothetical protein BD777DRAFT_31710 [Yarrowia lipolytica]|uniref:Uncharacterized protein n=1 Tax=Yarrowia lipolytica TaxID=4952 RepID=A0A1D8NDM5_YARLL|nr:hypothetical protein YALI1_D09417g [Yarrowia lipolytica]KAE8172659.1 hypothetical protein BKA90DRAFT_16782 [Yarrowia lipolytica]RMI99581.1 hypothetical protein BD777DRAFT_31710 [Yarrowia lipolytica]
MWAQSLVGRLGITGRTRRNLIAPSCGGRAVMRRRGFISQTCRVVFCSSSSTCLPHYDCPRLILGCLIVWQLSLTTIDWDRLTHSRVRMGDTEQPVNDRPSRYPQKKKAVRGRQLNSRIPPCSLTHCGPFRSATSHDMNNATELLMEPPPSQPQSPPKATKALLNFSYSPQR